MSRFPLIASMFVLVLLVVGVAVFVLTGGDVAVTARAMVLVVGLALLAFSRTLARTMRAGRRAAGRECPHCRRKILYEHEAVFCAVCGAALHARCEEEHRGTAHTERSGAYR